MACDRPILMSESTPCGIVFKKLISNDLLRLSNGKFMPNYVKALDVLRNFSIRGIGASVSIIYVGHIIGERQMPQKLENFMMVLYTFCLEGDIRFTNYILMTRITQNVVQYGTKLTRLTLNLFLYPVIIHITLER